MSSQATFAGGCFWCIEAAFNMLQGVHQATSGYMGGSAATANYRAVCSGSTEHAEVVQLDYDPAVISYSQLLEIFFALHDPTSLNKQGNDVGRQYRSAIFAHDEQQFAEASNFLQQAQADYAQPVVTELNRAGSFYPAEDYHQGYALANPQQPYCAFLIAPKLAAFRQHYASLLKPAGQ